ncbi:hypothetical protein N7478_011079 [Penicillium angulare]|uniref:uncharacterized protein n=1 Tax=Penicillium angulare TaxID=116970 RepID=UPI00253FADDF|nr:uncharacterized protein N7478_011079 [Penicillium angulare]KAJ5263474.1 hypothetical protein N7478_011079 [Penicillium angulare]
MTIAPSPSSTSTPALPGFPLPQNFLPQNVSSRLISTPDLTFHILESGATPAKDRPLVILLHGFPEIAYSWRRILPKLADAGYHAVAPDQRGFGRTTGWDTRPFQEVELHSFSLTNLVRDIIILVHALGYRSVQCVVGHDCGAITASMAALMRPDFFRSVVLMSHPFNGSPTLPFDTANEGNGTGTGSLEKQATLAEQGGGGGAEGSAAASGIHEALAQSGRKHYKWYYSTEEANSDMSSLALEDLHRFMRGYFHLKSASWPGNQPRPLKGWTAEEVMQMPYYYIMPLDDTMPQAVEKHMVGDPSQGKSSYSWLPEDELAVYVAEYARTGFQGGLNWYRVRTAAGGIYTKDYDLFAGKKIETPCSFISGGKDWGTYQEPGALEKMTSGAVCSDFRTLKVLDGVGHWIPQEAPDEVVQTVIDLTKGLA